jgi:sorting nexin-13
MRQVDWVPLLTEEVVDDFASHIRLYRRSKEKSEQQRAKQRHENNGAGQSAESASEDLETLFFDLELEMEGYYCRDLVSTSSHYESGKSF